MAHVAVTSTLPMLDSLRLEKIPREVGAKRFDSTSHHLQKVGYNLLPSSASSDADSEATLHLAILEDRVSPADFTAAASPALLPCAQDQEGPASPQLSMSSGSLVALCFVMPGARASPADFTASAAAAMLPFALDQEGQASSEPCASARSVVALCFAIQGGRASPTDLTAAAAAALLPFALVQFHQNSLRVQAQEAELSQPT